MTYKLTRCIDCKNLTNIDCILKEGRCRFDGSHMTDIYDYWTCGDEFERIQDNNELKEEDNV